jgi:hypothetical protein
MFINSWYLAVFSPRHDAGAARDIEHTLARLKARNADQIIGHRRCDGGDKKRW